jgi:hypothetical protein
MMQFQNKFNYICNILYYYISNKRINFHITRVCCLYDIGWTRSMIPTRGATRSSVPLWPFLMSTHGVAFTMANGTIYFILYLVEVTWTIHIIVVTLLHIVHLIMEALLLPSSLPHLSHGHVQYIVWPVIQRSLRWVKQRLKYGLPYFLLSR